MRLVLASGMVVCGITASVALAASQPRAIATSGVRVTVPNGWHAIVSKTLGCDPERLLVASSAPVRVGVHGRLAAPASTDVLVVLLEDRYLQDRPVGDLRRPKRFSVNWNGLVRLKAFCGIPDAPASMRYFKSHRRYLGFVVYSGARVDAATRANTLALMDSPHVSA